MMSRQREALIQVNCLPESKRGLMIKPEDLLTLEPSYHGKSTRVYAHKHRQPKLQLRPSNKSVLFTRQRHGLLSNTNQSTSHCRLIPSW